MIHDVSDNFFLFLFSLCLTTNLNRQLNDSLLLAITLTFLSLSPLMEIVVEYRRECVFPLVYQCLMSVQVFDLLFGLQTEAFYEEEDGASLLVSGNAIRKKLLQKRRQSLQQQQSQESPSSSKFFSPPFVVVHFYSVLFGCWISSLCYKLDWMKPWQDYPVCSISGAILASLLIHSLRVFWRFVKKIQSCTNY